MGFALLCVGFASDLHRICVGFASVSSDLRFEGHVFIVCFLQNQRDLFPPTFPFIILKGVMLLNNVTAGREGALELYKGSRLDH